MIKKNIIKYTFCFLFSGAAIAAPENTMEMMSGSFEGKYLLSGVKSVQTTFEVSGSYLVGKYTLFLKNGKKENGLLGPCLKKGDREILCIWRENKEFGSAAFIFDQNFNNFKGTWLPFSNNGIGGFAEVRPEDDNSNISWIGKRYNPTEGM